jgi:hypothetical protein
MKHVLNTPEYEHPCFHAETNDQYFCLLNSAEFEVSLRLFDNGVIRVVATRICEKRESQQADDSLYSAQSGHRMTSCPLH